MKILAIRLARFGDIVLLMPALTTLKGGLPESRLSLLVDQRWQALASMCPAVDEVIGVDRLGMRDGPRWRALRNIVGLTQEIRRRKFDLVIDFHGFRETNLLSWFSGARRRLGLKRFDQPFWEFCFNLPAVAEDKSIHVAEMFQRVARRIAVGGQATSPALVVPSEARAWAQRSLPLPRVVLFMGAPVRERMWLPERFAAVADHLVRDVGVPVVAIPGSADPDWVNRFLAAAQTRTQIQLLQDLSIPHLAAAIEDASLLVSNDTGPMHLGPALNVPTLALFSVGFPSHFGPTGAQDRFVQRESMDQLRSDEVIGMIGEMWPNVRSSLQR